MAVRTEKTGIYHIPKCAGIWVKEAVRRSGIYYWRCNNKNHPEKPTHPFGLLREHSTPENTEPLDDVYTICFVRHPVDWYKSFWAYRTKEGNLDLKFPPDRVWSDDFNKFVENVLDTYGAFVTQLYQYFVGESCDWVDFIGRQENVRADLITALTNAGETFDEDVIMNTPYFNVAGLSKKYGKLVANLSDENDQRIRETEHWVIDRFYSTTTQSLPLMSTERS